MRGGEVQTLGLIRNLEAMGCRCTLVARDWSPLLERAWGEGLQVVPWRPRGEWDLWSALQLRRWMAESRAALVHAHTAHALSLALLAAKGLHPRPKVVASRRVSFPLRSRLSRWKYRSADALVAVSEEVRQGLVAQGLDSRRVCTIHSGVNLARFRELPPRKAARARFGMDPAVRAVGSVGALVPHKGHALLVHGLRDLREQGLAVELYLAGDGPLGPALQAQGLEMGVPVHLLGYLQTPGDLYAALDVLVLPSLSGEGSPGVIKEAAACCVPVVATDVSGTREILRDGVESLLVPPGEPAALSAAVGRVLSEPGLAQRLVEAAHFRVRDFTMERMSQAHLALYRELDGALR